MITISAKIKKWGNSIGLILPKQITKKQHIKPEQDIVLHIENQSSMKVDDLFGINDNNINTAKTLKEIDKLFSD
jgi:antitoxin component of MazEF toxin-antitoxin module